MIAKFDENSYIDSDSITYISGQYTSKDEARWQTTLVTGGEHLVIFGKPGRNIMDAYLWRHKHSVYNMIPDSKDYKKPTE